MQISWDRVLGPHKEAEVVPCYLAFLSFGCVLCSYFLLVPIREEVGITLGLASLPSLFTASLIMTLIMAPLTTNFLCSSPRGLGHQRLFAALACMQIGFYMAISLASPHTMQRMGSWTRGLPRDLQADDLGAHADLNLSEEEDNGKELLSSVQRTVYACFYIWLGIQNQASISSLWALCADVFDADAGTRLFGFIGAGATVGQLLGSAVVVATVKAQALFVHRSRPGPPTQLLLASACMLLAASWLSRRLSASAHALALRHTKAAQLLPAGAGPRHSAALSTSHEGSKAASQHSHGGIAAASDASNYTEHAPPDRGALGGLKAQAAQPSALSHVVHGPAGLDDPAGAAVVAAGLGGARAHPVKDSLFSAFSAQVLDMVACVRLIAQSPYLVALCAYMMLQCCTAAIIYFVRATIVSTTLKTASARTAYFGMINGITAVSIFGLQLLATGRIIKMLGVPVILCISPIVATLGMILIACRPSAWMVAVVEMLRKLCGHALTKAAREILFTVVTRQEKYRAKVFMDMVLMRVGDTAAAALFEALDVQLQLGPRALASVGALLCISWLLVARHLGVLYSNKLMQPAGLARPVVLTHSTSKQVRPSGC